MNNEPLPVTRSDLDAIWRAVTENGRRIEGIDNSGTRGTGALAVQLTEVIKDVAELKTSVTTFQREHQAQHQRESAARLVSRRWAVATGIAFLAAVEGPLFYLIHIH